MCNSLRMREVWTSSRSIDIGIRITDAPPLGLVARKLFFVDFVDFVDFVVCAADSYDPARGDPEHGIEPGTAFKDIPQQWRCPDCGLGKEVFIPQER